MWPIFGAGKIPWMEKNGERTGQDGTSDDGQRCIVVINIYENVKRKLLPEIYF